jgi:glutamate N-acetyltransferase/amino-acid N-acetyltransferase
MTEPTAAPPILASLEHHPQGFLSCAKNVGIRDDTLDFTVVFSTTPAAAAAMFTQSLFAGAPIIVGREHAADHHLQAVVVNSKNANVATGEAGIAAARETCRLIADELGIQPEAVFPSSTGVIGWQLPMDKIKAGIPGLRAELRTGDLETTARAIMTTDTRPKYRCARIGDAVLVGMCKGSGMIAPNMATMLAFFYTDAAVDAAALQSLLREAVAVSFNMVSVDTDTSTSDTVIAMANGLAGEVDPDTFQTALDEVCIHLAKEVARDGEGASKLIEVAVTSARDDAQAKRIAKAIINSPLVKTAVHGADPNWGRLAMAIGKCHEESDISPERVRMAFGDTCVFARGEPQNVDLQALEAYLQAPEVRIVVDLGLTDGQATAWGCDLTEEYVRINALYTT